MIFFLVGLSVGSFINAFQYRVQIGKKNTGRSFCPKCKHQLAWYDLIPLLSFFLLKGRCRYCGKAISIQYPLIEFITAVLFVAVGIKSGYIQKINDLLLGSLSFSNKEVFVILLSVLCLLLIVGCLVLIALHDFKTKYVLSLVVYVTMGASLSFLIVNYGGQVSSWPLFEYFYPFVAPSLIAAGIFFAIYAISRGKWMGAGDIEIAAMMGVVLGWPDTMIAFYVAFILGAIIGTVLLVAQKAKLKTEVPFGPFLITGTFVAYLFGTQIVWFYDRIFLGF
jgi:prepilin signal peptidase PulO-like enzyme (type II secretory pathway)